MSLIDFIQKLQNKPHYLRVQILWFSVAFVMIIIVSLWMVSLKYSFPSTAKETQFKEITQDLPSLKEVFKASIGSFFEDNLNSEDIEKESVNTFELEKIKPARLPLSD